MMTLLKQDGLYLAIVDDVEVVRLPINCPIDNTPLRANDIYKAMKPVLHIYGLRVARGVDEDRLHKACCNIPYRDRMRVQ